MTVFTVVGSLMLAGVIGVFGYHIWLGLRTGIVRFPVSFLVLEEFERDRSAGFFWGVMVVNMAALIGALLIAIFVAWGALTVLARPVDRLQTLNGCYEGKGLPDFMRPRVHWTFRVENGVIFDRTGNAVSNIRLLGSSPRMTSVSFSPGILISGDEHESSTVFPGNTVRGNAYLIGDRATIALTDDWGNVMQTTSCG